MLPLDEIRFLYEINSFQLIIDITKWDKCLVIHSLTINYFKSANSALLCPNMSTYIFLNHSGAIIPNCVSFNPIVCFPSTKTLYSQDIAKRHPPAGLAPFINKVTNIYIYISQKIIILIIFIIIH